ncbi:MAG: hypothetical protein ABWZ25_08835 [Chitinophagaceae bacterium]
MKILLVLFVFVIVSCGLGSGNDVEHFIPGIYVAEWRTEFAYAKDTLQIKQADQSQQATYIIGRRTYYQYNQQTKPLPPQHKVETWIASWSAGTGILTVDKNGRSITFQPEDKLLKMGIKVYRKL